MQLLVDIYVQLSNLVIVPTVQFLTAFVYICFPVDTYLLD